MKKGSNLQESFSFMQEPTGKEARPPFDPKLLFRLAAQGVFLGTSSWKYRGWEGMIYRGGYSSEAQFQRASLREYSNSFPCVGVEFTYFAWPTLDMMAYLRDSVSENFRFCPKVTKRITLKRFPQNAVYGKWAGQENPDFLNADLFCDQFIKPIEQIQDRLGVILFDFHDAADTSADQLRQFFAAIPKEYRYSVEFREPEAMTEERRSILREFQVATSFALTERSLPLAEQFALYKKSLLDSGASENQAPMIILAELSGRSSEQAVKLFQPYDVIKEVNDSARAAIVEIVQYAKQEQRKIYVLVSNKLEGSSPHTIGAISQRIAEFC